MRITETVLTVMVMIRDAATDRVVVQERTKNWCGLTFPGGHVEAGESLVAAAAREAREETGLSVDKLSLCGVIHWCEERTDRRYLVFAYKAEVFTGELTCDDAEGKVFWMPLEEMRGAKLSPNMDVMLEVFLREDAGEAFGEWVEDFSAPMEVFNAVLAGDIRPRDAGHIGRVLRYPPAKWPCWRTNEEFPVSSYAGKQEFRV